MEALIPPPQEKKLPSPNEKLLRSPTFWERQGKTAKWLAIGSIILFLFLMLSTLLLLSRKSTIVPIQPAQSPTPAATTIKNIEISSDQKSILNAKTKEVILTIENAKNYLKDSGYEYNPNTFQTTNAKYLGDCFGNAALSNKKDRIVFSAICLPGDLPQPWIGIYNIPNLPPNAGSYPNPVKLIKFLIGGGGNNFIWSQDDKTITYEATLGLSGLSETRTIDSNTGEILEKKNSPVTSDSETTNWKTYTNKKYKFEIILPDSWKEYSILTESWQGNTLDGSSKKYQGPQIIIRNPKWNTNQPWQDIPIMVFTKEEWKLIEARNLGVSAAPIGPAKLDENQKYVFALPPRWIGFTNAFGQDEAEKIVKSFKAIQF